MNDLLIHFVNIYQRIINTMKDIKHITEQYINQKTSPLKIQGDMVHLINQVGKELRFTRKVNDIEKYITILHLILIGNSSQSERQKEHYVRLSEVVFNDIDN